MTISDRPAPEASLYPVVGRRLPLPYAAFSMIDERPGMTPDYSHSIVPGGFDVTS